MEYFLSKPSNRQTICHRKKLCNTCRSNAIVGTEQKAKRNSMIIFKVFCTGKLQQFQNTQRSLKIFCLKCSLLTRRGHIFSPFCAIFGSTSWNWMMNIRNHLNHEYQLRCNNLTSSLNSRAQLLPFFGNYPVKPSCPTLLAWPISSDCRRCSGCLPQNIFSSCRNCHVW